MQVAKAKRQTDPVARKAPSVRAEVVDRTTRARLESELEVALKQRQGTEIKLAGALRAIAPFSASVRAAMADAVTTMQRRAGTHRELYAGSLRALAEAEDQHAPALLKTALAGDEGGGSCAMCSACFCRDPLLAAPLARIAASRQSHLAFSAETARVARGESNGALLASLAPMIKESHRISLCVELFVPIARGPAVPIAIGPALAVLRSAERHLGRWLVLGEVAVKAGDGSPLEDARAKAGVGPTSARAAWSLVCWALLETGSRAGRGDELVPPSTRPTVELVARLSDRPSADRDTTFLFRMARAKAAVTKPMLESLARTPPLGEEVAIRAALFLARDYGREDMQLALDAVTQDPKRESLHGLAAAALWDAGVHDRARALTDELIASKMVGNVAWGILIRAADARLAEHGGDGWVVDETALRWIHWGWLE